MAITEVTAKTYGCDRVGCGKSHTVSPGQQVPGVLLELDALTTGLAEDDGRRWVYACGKSHVGPAVSARLDELADEPDAVSAAGPGEEDGDPDVETDDSEEDDESGDVEASVPDEDDWSADRPVGASV